MALVQRAQEFLRAHRRWGIVALLFLVATTNNLDRQVLSVLAPTLRERLHFGAVEYSNIVAAFLVAYTLGYAFSGRWIDRWGARLGLAAGLIAWSLAGIAHAWAAGWVGLLACRFLLGLGESFNSPGGLKAIAEWVPVQERGLAAAIFSNGNVMGAMLAPPLVSFLAIHLGWQWAFILTGVAGLGLAAVWWRAYDAPERHCRITAGERELILAQRPVVADKTPAAALSFGALLRDRQCLAFCFARFLTDATNYFFAFWLPDYLQQGRGFSLGLLGVVGWLPFLAADIGGPGGGWLSDRLIRRGMAPGRARLTLMAAAALAMPLTMLVVRVDPAWLALSLMALALAAQSCWMANQLALLSESAPRGGVATLVAVSAMAGGIGGIIANLVAGRVIAAHGYFLVFSLAGWAHVVAWVALVAARRAPRSG